MGRRVAGGHDVQPHRVVEFDCGGHLPKLGGEVGAGGCGSGEEPVPQLALLRPGEPGHLGGCAGPVLDQRERLQHRIVQVGGDLRALLLPDAGGALGHQVGPQPHHAGGGHHPGAEHDHDHRENRRQRIRPGAPGHQQQRPGHHEQRRPERPHEQPVTRAAAGIVLVERETPGHGAAGEQGRPDDGGNGTDCRIGQNDGHHRHDGAAGQQQRSHRRPPAHLRVIVVTAAGDRHERPQPAVEQQAGTAQQREDDHARGAPGAPGSRGGRRARRRLRRSPTGVAAPAARGRAAGRWPAHDCQWTPLNPTRSAQPANRCGREIRVHSG